MRFNHDVGSSPHEPSYDGERRYGSPSETGDCESESDRRSNTGTNRQDEGLEFHCDVSIDAPVTPARAAIIAPWGLTT